LLPSSLLFSSLLVSSSSLPSLFLNCSTAIHHSHSHSHSLHFSLHSFAFIPLSFIRSDLSLPTPSYIPSLALTYTSLHPTDQPLCLSLSLTHTHTHTYTHTLSISHSAHCPPTVPLFPFFTPLGKHHHHLLSTSTSASNTYTYTYTYTYTHKHPSAPLLLSLGLEHTIPLVSVVCYPLEHDN
jgi:hypothetical protein